jgi:protein-disulfide isomerase
MRLERQFAMVACLPILATLTACGSALTATSLPSQSGTLTNAALTSTAKPEPFNPFGENDTPAAGKRLIIENPTMAQVLQTGALPERALGRNDAPVTIVKYASMTCPYCRQFQKNTFPILKRRYIDTGTVRFILREFPIGFQSGAATIALRCVPADKYFVAYDALMKAQPQWTSQKIRREPIWRVVRKLGLKRDAFDACYQDKKLIADLNAVKERGRTLGVIGTPNFFINNKLYKRVLTMTDFDQAVASQVSAAAQ